MTLHFVPYARLFAFMAERAHAGEAWQVVSDLGHHSAWSVLCRRVG